MREAPLLATLRQKSGKRCATVGGGKLEARDQRRRRRVDVDLRRPRCGRACAAAVTCEEEAAPKALCVLTVRSPQATQSTCGVPFP